MAAGVAAMVANAALAAPAAGAPGARGTGAGVSVEVTAPWPRLDHRRWARHPACPGQSRAGRGPTTEPTTEPAAGAADGSGVEPGSARVTMTG